MKFSDNSLTRGALSCMTAAMLAGCGGSQAPIGGPGAIAQAHDHKTRSKTFGFTGSAQSFVVPQDVTSLTVTADGASGASGADYVGGDGGEVKAVVPVTSGETIYVVVGGEGGVSTGENSGAGGFNGGGNGGLANGFSGSGGYGGGGASDVRMQNSGISSRILVAGGGGGPGIWGIHGAGGAGGGRFGAPGSDSCGKNSEDGCGGTGGRQHRGGAGGRGGGGGGSSYVESSAKMLKNLQGTAPAGNGEVIFSWTTGSTT